MLTVVVPAFDVEDRPLRIHIEARGWRDGNRVVYHYQVLHKPRGRASNVVVLDGDDRRGPATPAGRSALRAAAASLASFLAAAGESLAHRGEDSEYWPEYTPAQRDLLIDSYERFAAIAST